LNNPLRSQQLLVKMFVVSTSDDWRIDINAVTANTAKRCAGDCSSD